MNKTTEEQIYDFKDFLDAEKVGDQAGHTNRLILNHLLNYRATVLKKKKSVTKISDLNYQTLSLKLQEVTDEDLPCVGSSNCVLLRSVIELPDYIDLKSVTTALNRSGNVFKLSEVDSDFIKFKQYSKIPAQKTITYYYLQNVGKGTYIYVWSNLPLFLEQIDVKAVFYRPYIIEAINSCGGTLDPCFNYLKARFPMDPELLTEVYSMALNYLLRGKVQVTDTSNDGLNSVVSNPSPTK